MTTAPDIEPGFQPITDSAELARLSPTEIVNRVRPLMRKTTRRDKTEARYERYEANAPSVCAELAHAWKENPTLTGSDKPVSFGDYLAARLAITLRDLDQEHHPDLYDRHRKYLGERDDIPLDQEVTAAGETDLAGEEETEPRTSGYSSNDPDSFMTLGTPWDQPSWLSNLQAALGAARIESASQAALASAMHSIAIGKTRSAYRFARALGETSQDARYHPATSAYLAALDVIDIGPDDLPGRPVATAP